MITSSQSSSERSNSSTENPSIFRRTVDGMEWLSEGVNTIITKLQNLSETNYELACEMIEKGNITDAIYRLKFVLWLSPNFHVAHYHLGCCYANQDKIPNAIAELKKAYHFLPDNLHVRFMLASLCPEALVPEHTPTTMPPDMTTEAFDAQAPFYNQLQANNGYKGHIHIANILAQHLDEKRTDYRMLDLGCGTGLMGQMLHYKTATITGIDISSAMTEIARNITDKSDPPLSIYTAMHTADIQQWLPEQNKNTAELIIATELIPYLGTCELLFKEAARLLTKDGFLAVSYVQSLQHNNYGMDANIGKFAHNDNYLRQLAKHNQLAIISLETIQSYPELSEQLLLCKKQ